ncbi:hypothetical protein PQR32_22730 [Paraburkholderia dipogonis]
MFFYGYWRQDGDSGVDLSGDHIDLWNKDTLTPSAESFLRFRVGVPQDSQSLVMAERPER